MKRNRVSRSPFQLRSLDEASREQKPGVHVYGAGVVCGTDKRGHAEPQGRSPAELVVDASQGVIPLWASDVTLRWRFQEKSMLAFEDPDLAKAEVRTLLGEALLAWGDAAPVRFAERNDLWDFEIVMRRLDDCDVNGCVLARAFFPDAGRHDLVLYPKMFTQTRKEQIDTLIHETGHIFGLRHFFAQVTETAWPSEVFGEHRPFSIMNYGAQSELTEDDKADLRRLYQLARSGDLEAINKTRIRLVEPYSAPGYIGAQLAWLARPGLAATADPHR